MKKFLINVILPTNRSNTGWLTLESKGEVVAKYKVLGRGSRGGGDTSLQKDGNTPTGSYSGSEIVDTSTWNQKSYGPWGAIRMKPIGGKAIIAKRKGRFGFLIHGGSLGAAGYWRGQGALRATNGCLRLSNDDMKDLLFKIRNFGHHTHPFVSLDIEIKITVSEK